MSPLDGPFYDRLSVGQELPRQPSITIDDGMAALYQSLVGERLPMALDGEITRAVTGRPGRLASALDGLTPTQVRICQLIRRGLTAKEIARIEHLSPETVATHRRNIRRKLGITNRDVNLTTHLESLFSTG